jgi:hypothetical protein
MDRRLAAGTIAIAASVVSLAAPAGAFAKGDAIATISSPTRCDAAPGARLVIRFRVTTTAADGTRTPFGASGVFVVLRRAGHPALKLRARSAGAGTGRYVVRTRMPRGLRRIDAGIDGTTSAPGGATRPAPALFRVVGDPCRSAMDV